MKLSKYCRIGLFTMVAAMATPQATPAQSPPAVAEAKRIESLEKRLSALEQQLQALQPVREEYERRKKAESEQNELGGFPALPIEPSQQRVIPDTRLEVGQALQVEENGRFWAAKVLALMPDETVKIHYVGWGDSYDCAVPRSRLRLDPEAIVKAKKSAMRARWRPGLVGSARSSSGGFWALALGAPWRSDNDNAEQRAKARETWQLCRQLPGYDALRKAFEVQQADRASPEGMPESLVVRVHTTNRGPIDTVCWANPLEKGKPKLDWNALLRVYAEAGQSVAPHAWLPAWRDDSPGRRIELHLLGDRIGESDADLKNTVVPLWRDAGFRGEPRYCVVGVRSDNDWMQLYFGREEPRALITASSHPDPSAEHWADRLDVYFDPREATGEGMSKYAVVDPSGKSEIRTYRAVKR